MFAVLAFGGVALVLLSAPPGGDASLEGDVFGVLAMLLLVGYVASTRYYRREMDGTTFMATIRPIATVQAVRPNVERELLELTPGLGREHSAGRVQLELERHGAHSAG